MTIEEEIIEQAGYRMAREIDREVLWGMLEDLGWIRAGYYAKTLIGQHIIDEVQQWVKDNTSGHYECCRTDFLFESAKDAQWFVLRWGTQ